MTPAAGVLFGVLMAMVIVWFVLVSWLYRRLRERHAATYEKMGSPTLFLNNSIGNGLLFMRFLWRSEFDRLAGPELARVCRVMQVFFVVYLALFVTLFFVASTSR